MEISRYCRSTANVKLSGRITHFCTSSHRLRATDILRTVDYEHLGQGYGAQHSQWFHPMANINLY